MNSIKQSNQQKGISLIYLRNAATQQINGKVSLAKQEKICLAFAKRQGYECAESTDVYADAGKSGMNTNRPGLNKMLQRCKSDKGVKAVIINDISRLSRKRIDFTLIREQLKKSDIKLLSVTEPIDDTPEGELLASMLSSMAQYQAQAHSRRVKAALALRRNN
jgi:DNA invertase Pin-like site-specific DNA recombinase